MSNFDEYRKIAQQKYLKKKKEETNYEEERIRMDNEYLEMTMALIINSIEFVKENINEKIDTDIQTLTKTLINNIDFFEKQNKLDEIRDLVIKFVDFVNTTAVTRKINNYNIKILSDEFAIIFDILKLDISIEKMDISEDEIIAMRIQNELYNEVWLNE